VPKSYEAKWDPEALSMMCNLKFLIINQNVQLPRGLKCLCRSLKFLQWLEYPLEALPDGVELDEIIELRMHHSKIKYIWSETQVCSILVTYKYKHILDIINFLTLLTIFYFYWSVFCKAEVH
jgi:hypothetical protein